MAKNVKIEGNIPTPPVDLVITNEELQQLDRLINEFPTKYGVPLLQFFQMIHAKRRAEQDAAKEKPSNNGLAAKPAK